MTVRSLRVAVAFTLLALALLALPGSAPGARDPDRWLEARSPHFVVISNAGEEQARRVSLEFERVRALLRLALTKARLDPRQPPVVLAVNGERSLRELLPQFWERKGQRPVAGHWEGPRRHYIALRVDAPDHERYRRVLHEYVHLLTHANVPDAPAWLGEGLSEFWSTAVVQNDAVEIGRPAPHHLKALGARRSWIPLDELLAMERAPDARDEQRLSLFYAQSWALAHYLMLGGSSTNLHPTAHGAVGAPDLELAPSSYVERLRQGANPVEAGTLAFGNLSQLEQALAAYVRTGRFRALRMEVPRQGDESAGRDEDMRLRVRALSPAESLAVRAGFLLDGERPAAALPLLTEALGLDPNETSVLETLGYFHFHQNNPTEAAGWFDRAIASGSASHLAYFYRAILAGPVPGRVSAGTLAGSVGTKSVRLKPDTTGGNRLKPDTTDEVGGGREQVRAEDHLRRAIDLNPEFAPAYVRLADLYAREAARLEDALPLMRRATELEPENPAYWVDLGNVLLKLNRPREAQEAGERGLAAARSASLRGLVEAFLRDVGTP